MGVFIVCEAGRTTAHHGPQRLELDANSLTDSTGRLHGTEPAGATEEGYWVDYLEQLVEGG